MPKSATDKLKNWVPGRIRERARQSYLPNYGDLPKGAIWVIRFHSKRFYKSFWRVVTLSDLVQEGIVAAMKIAPGFDEAKGRPIAYFTPRVKGAMLDFLRSVHPFGTGACRRETRERKLGLPKSVPGVLQAPILPYGNRETLPDGLLVYDPEPSDSPAREFRAALKKMMPWLSPAEKELLVYYFVYGERLKAIGERMGYSESRMSLMLSGVLKKAREQGAHAGTLVERITA